MHRLKLCSTASLDLLVKPQISRSISTILRFYVILISTAAIFASFPLMFYVNRFMVENFISFNY